ncbi:hypothetical protein [Flavobacterium foetidum]|uniref:hypothetical protein n=1 Tax=Flavobacterium foetidum TaxID=2026681 RepID=UPI001074F93F|nr:hypothetical protein [Flavobacterium foetidum]KAF2515699.1 hypothetical protein E0W73_08910 [Flavobacterium foetidum]
MNDLLLQFESELRAFMEFRYNASGEQDTVKRFNETEKAVFEFVDNYLLNSPDLIAADVERSTQNIINEFIDSKIK